MTKNNLVIGTFYSTCMNLLDVLHGCWIHQVQLWSLLWGNEYEAKLYTTVEPVPHCYNYWCIFVELVCQHDGTVLVKTFDWIELLSSFFKKLNNITEYQHFRFDSKKELLLVTLIWIMNPRKSTSWKKNIIFDVEKFSQRKVWGI